MFWESLVYYLGYGVALALCRGLGKLFFVPMLLNMGFNIALQAGLLSNWDYRWIFAGHGFLFFLWVAALAGIFDRVTVVVLILVDLLAVYRGLLPQFQIAGTGETFWHMTSTSIIHVWLISILVVSLSAIFKSSLISLWENGYSQLLVIPKRRFLIPIAAWATIILLPEYLGGMLPAFIYQKRFIIAGFALVWGWVAIELPFYIMYKRMNGDHE